LTRVLLRQRAKCLPSTWPQRGRSTRRISFSEWLPNVVNGWTVGAGHFNQLEAPDQINAVITGFLRHYV
jgi:hypothetical protein